MKVKLGDRYNEVLYIYYGGEIESFGFGYSQAVVTVLLLYIVFGEREAFRKWAVL